VTYIPGRIIPEFPQSDAGRPIRETGGKTLYFGDIQAPVVGRVKMSSFPSLFTGSAPLASIKVLSWDSLMDF